MSASGGSQRTRNDDRYEPEQQGVRNIAARDGYDPGDGFQRPNPQVWTDASTTSPSTYLPSTYSTTQQRRRRSSTGARGGDDYNDGFRTRQTDAYRPPQYDYGREYALPRRNRSAPRGREYAHEGYSDSESDDEYDEGRGRALARRRASAGRASERGRSRSAGIRQKLQDMFGPDENEMAKDNSEAKKWAATVAGAVAGGFAARTAKKDHWVPAALGAFLGGLTAREAEKAYYSHREVKIKEMEAWEARRTE